jgi:uncharacterized protein YhjY with autotransporter beta-barrel domain
MTKSTLRASTWVLALTVAGTGTVFGQAAPPPLTTFVNNSTTATPLQKTTGLAVQSLCTHLGANEPSPGFQLPAGSAKLDAFLRCNEMVQTAREINTGVGTRTLHLDSDQLLGALQNVSGEELSSQGALTTRVSSGQFANISGRLNALRFGAQSAATRGRTTASLSPQSSSGVLAYQPDRVVDPNAFRYDADDGQFLKTSTFLPAGDASETGGGTLPPIRWGWFSEGSYNFGDHDQTPGEDAFDFDAVSGTIGADYNFGSAVLGASIGYDRYKADFDTNAFVNGGNVEVKGGSGSLFGAWFGNHVTLDAIASYGTLSSDIERRLFIQSNNNACVPACPTQDRTFTGSPDGHYLSAGVSAGYDLDVASWSLGFSVAGSYRDVKIDSYAESESVPNGGLALAYGEQTVESFRSIVGFSLSRAFGREFGIIMPSFRAEWHHEFKDDPRTIQAQYAIEPTLTNRASACVSCFALQSDSPESDFGIAGAGLSFTFARRFQGYIYYEALLGVSNYKSNSIALGFRGQL